MPLEIPDALKADVITAYLKLKPAYESVGATILPERIKEGTTVSWDMKEEDIGLAPIVGPESTIRLDKKGNIERYTQTLVEIRLGKSFLRQEIAALYDIRTTNKQFANEYVREEFDILDTKVARRIEQLRWQLFTTGKITYNGDGVYLDVDYNIPATNFKTASPLWSAANSDPLKDLQDWMYDFKKLNKGVPVTNICFNTSVAKLLVQNDAIRTLLKYTEGDIFIAIPAMITMLEKNLRVTISLVDEAYEADDGTEKLMMPDGKLIMLNKVDAYKQKLGEVITGQCHMDETGKLAAAGKFAQTKGYTGPLEVNQIVGEVKQASFPILYFRKRIMICTVG